MAKGRRQANFLLPEDLIKELKKGVSAREQSKRVPEALMSGFLHHNARDDVGGLISPVCGIEQVAIDLTHLKHVNGVTPFEEISQGKVVGLLHRVFISLGLDRVIRGNLRVVFQDLDASLISRAAFRRMFTISLICSSPLTS